MMNTLKLATIITLTVACAGQPVMAAKMYKWVDEHGTVHYSDKLPPDSSKKAHDELNERGIMTKSVNRAKTDQEREAERLALEAEKQKRRAAAEKAAKARMQDQILLDTFTTERDLLMARDDRLGSIDSLIKITEGNNSRLTKQIKSTKASINDIASNNREVPENLTKKLSKLEQQFAKNRDFIKAKQQKRAKTETQFEAYLKRFRELKNPDPEGNNEEAAAEDEQSATERDSLATNLQPAQ